MKTFLRHLLLILVTTVMALASMAEVAERDAARRLVVTLGTGESSGGVFGAGIVFAVQPPFVYVATAKHVVRPRGRAPKDLEVGFESWKDEKLPALLLEIPDSSLDLAVLRIDLTGRNIPARLLPAPATVGYAAADHLDHGVAVYPVGHPQGREWYVPTRQAVVHEVDGSEIDFEPACGIGHSGGALFDQSWRLVGMLIKTDVFVCTALSFKTVAEQLAEWHLSTDLPFVEVLDSDMPAETQPPVGADQGSIELEISGDRHAGAALTVRCRGPVRIRDWIELTYPGSEVGSYLTYVYVEDPTEPVHLVAPSKPGAYELRYVGRRPGGKRMLTSRSLEVLPPEVELRTPARIRPARSLSVPWKGPDAPKDYISIARPGSVDDAYLDYANTSSGSPAQMTSPQESGSYEIRYVSGRYGKVLARTVTRVDAAFIPDIVLKAPATVRVVQSFEVSWQGPDNSGDFIAIVPAGAAEADYLDYEYTSYGSPASLDAPSRPGRYELRYVAGIDDRTLEAVALVVEAAPGAVPAEPAPRRPEGVDSQSPSGAEQASAELEVAGDRHAGAELTVRWRGGARALDWIELTYPGAAAGSYLTYAIVKSPTKPVSLVAPPKAGTYELRYSGFRPRGGRRILASRSLEVLPADVELWTSAKILSDQSLSVSWKGPDAPRDYLSIARPGSAGDDYLDHAMTSSGNPVRMRSPQESGRYEIRYVSGHYKKVLTKTVIQVDSVSGG